MQRESKRVYVPISECRIKYKRHLPGSRSILQGLFLPACGLYPPEERQAGSALTCTDKACYLSKLPRHRFNQCSSLCLPFELNALPLVMSRPAR